MSDDVERVAWAICGPEQCEKLCNACKLFAARAIAAMQPAPTLPSEPEPGRVRVRVAVWVDEGGGAWRARPVEQAGSYVRRADAILVADVKPMTPPTVVASVEGQP